MTARPVIIDTDGGVDDALAILLAGAAPELDIRAITTVFGNVGLAQATKNVALVLEVAGRGGAVEIAAGHVRPLLRTIVDAEAVHGADGLGGVTLAPDSEWAGGTGTSPDLACHAPERLIAAARAHGADLGIVAVGPLTNLAAAWLAAPEVMAGIGDLVIMGGAVSGKGNVTATAEFNFFCDPEAAAIVMASAMPKTLVPLELTHQALLTREEVRRWGAAHESAGARFVAAITGHYMDFYRKKIGHDGCHPHDALAVATLIAPGLFRFEPQCVAVETGGALGAGMSVVDHRGGQAPNAKVGVGVDAPGFSALLEERIWRRAL